VEVEVQQLVGVEAPPPTPPVSDATDEPSETDNPPKTSAYQGSNKPKVGQVLISYVQLLESTDPSDVEETDEITKDHSAVDKAGVR